MNTNQYTQKTIEAIQAAQQLAVEYQHNALEPKHLRLAISSQENALIPQPPRARAATPTRSISPRPPTRC